MITEEQLLEKFQVEELEKRFEMKGWAVSDNVEVSPVTGEAPNPEDPFGPYDTWYGVGVTIGLP